MNLQPPNASVPIHPSYPQSPDPTLSDPRWLNHLPRHSIFTDIHPKDASQFSALDATNPSLIAVRSTDLISVVANQIRITSLVEAKSALSNNTSWSSPRTTPPTRPSFQLSYKVLSASDPSHLDFPIHHISVNPTGKLLAVVGESRVSLLVLPRSGYNKQVGSHIVARSVSVGVYYHFSHASTAISKVQWHPWGEGGTSLLVLTQDGLFHEYDVARDTEEPQQTASFLPLTHSSPLHRGRSRSRSATPTASSLAASLRKDRSISPSAPRHVTPTANAATSSFGLGLSADDEEANVAVSFSLCVSNAPSTGPSIFDNQSDDSWAKATRRARGPDDWSPLTVFGLMKNGDIWAICPFMPRNSTIPMSYIHSLSRFTSLKLSAAAESTDPYAQLDSDFQLRFLNSLLKQASESQDRSERQSSVLSSRSSSGLDLDDQDPSHLTSDDFPVRVHPPPWSYSHNADSAHARKAPLPQGPFLLKPAPVELCDDRESGATDIIWTWLDKSSWSAIADRVAGIGTIAIVGHDGRVDVGVLMDSIEARWANTITTKSSKTKSPASRAATTKPFRSNRYALSDTEDEEDLSLADSSVLDLSQLKPRSLPSLLMYETIDLGLLDSIMECSSLSRSQSSDLLQRQAANFRPCFVRDPLYKDVIYVYHSLGAQCLGFTKWAHKLINILNLPSEEEVDDLETALYSSAAAALPNKLNPASTENREQALTKMMNQGETTQVVWIVKTVSAAEQTPSEVSTNPVTGVCVLSDVYLSYSFLAVTRDSQLVALELSLRVDQEDSELTSSSEVNAAESKHKSYVSLLGDGPPFTPPNVFQQVGGSLQGLPFHPRRAAISSSTSSGSTGEIQVTPTTLRQLGKTVETFRADIRDIVQAGNAVQSRLDLQTREMSRQLEKLNLIRKRICQLQDSNSIQQRILKISQNQQEMVKRTDRILQKLMDTHQPTLSVYERKWFNELNRIAKEVQGSSSSSKKKGGLVAKADELNHHLSYLRPSLQQQQQQFNDSSFSTEFKQIGTEQLRKVQAMLHNEAQLLTEAKDKIHHINRQLSTVAFSSSSMGLSSSSSGSSFPSLFQSTTSFHP